MPVLQCLLDGTYYFWPLSLCSSSVYMLDILLLTIVPLFIQCLHAGHITFDHCPSVHPAFTCWTYYFWPLSLCSSSVYMLDILLLTIVPLFIQCLHAGHITFDHCPSVHPVFTCWTYYFWPLSLCSSSVYMLDILLLTIVPLFIQCLHDVHYYTLP